MKILNSGVYRFQNDLHLDDFGLSNNNVNILCDDVVYYGLNIDNMGGDKYVEYGATSVYYQSSKWQDNKYKKIFIDNDYEVSDDVYSIINTYATHNYTLTYNTNGGNTISPVYEVLNIPLLPTPVKSGYTFLGWYYDNNTFLHPVNYGDVMDDDITIYAKWKDSYTVIFNANGGTIPVPLINVQTITSLPNSIRSGYVFDGWYYDNNTFLQPVYVGDIVTDDITIYAKWLTAYDISFETNGGSAIATMYDELTIPANLPIPVKNGFNFIGWYYDNEFNTSVVIGDVLTQNVTLYARWVNADLISLTLFNNTTEDKKVDKTNYLVNAKVLYGTLRKATSITRSIIEIEYDDVFDYNYAYISLFNRYYFITDIISLRTGLWQINLKCDVLMSFKNQILNKEVIVDRQEFNYNDYLVDDKIPAQTNPIIEVEEIETDDVIKSTNQYNDNYILELGGKNYE